MCIAKSFKNVHISNGFCNVVTSPTIMSSVVWTLTTPLSQNKTYCLAHGVVIRFIGIMISRTTTLLYKIYVFVYVVTTMFAISTTCVLLYTLVPLGNPLHLLTNHLSLCNPLNLQNYVEDDKPYSFINHITLCLLDMWWSPLQGSVLFGSHDNHSILAHLSTKANNDKVKY